MEVWWDRLPGGDDLEPGGEHRMNVFQGHFPGDNTGADGYLATAPVTRSHPTSTDSTTSPGTCGSGATTGSTSLTTRVRRVQQSARSGFGATACATRSSYLCHLSYCRRYRVSARFGSEPASSAGHTGFRVAADVCRPLHEGAAGARRSVPSSVPLSAIFFWASAIAPLSACTWLPSASPTTFWIAHVRPARPFSAAECGYATIRPAPPIGIVSPAIFSIPLPIFLCNALPPTAPMAAPIAVAASSGGANSRRRARRRRAGRALGDRVVGLLQRDVALEVLAHDDRAPEVRTASEHRFVVLVRGLGRQVAADQHVGRLVVDRHRVLLASLVHADNACAALAVVLGGVHVELVLRGEVRRDVEHDLLHRAGDANGFLSS